MASRLALTSSLVRPVLTLCGWSSASQPATLWSSRLWMSSHCSPSSSSKAVRGCAARAAARADDRESALELLAVEPELELAVPDRLARLERGRLGLPRPPVPDDHVAGAVLLGRDDALEVEVLDGVVLDVDRHPPDLGVQGRALGDRPGDEDAIDLEAEVVVEPRGPMALHDESAGLAAARRSPGPGRAPASSRSRACADTPRAACPSVCQPRAGSALRAGTAPRSRPPTPPSRPMSLPPAMSTRPSSRQRRGVAAAGRAHRADRAEVRSVAGSNISVEDRTRHCLAVAPVAAGDEDAPVGQQRRGVLLSPLAHRARGAEPAGPWVVHLGAVVHGVLRRPATEDEDPPVREQRGGVQPAAGLERAGLAEPARRRVIHIGGLAARIALAATADRRARGRPRAGSRCGCRGTCSSSRSC